MNTYDVREELVTSFPLLDEWGLELAGVSTPVLEGGDGLPMVLLHGPGESAVGWLPVLPDLVRSHRVIAPDLPGHGASQIVDGELDADRVLRWLGELIERTCPTPPVLVGRVIGGTIGARLAIEHPARLAQLVLVDTLGLAPFEPAPRFTLAMHASSRTRPNTVMSVSWSSARSIWMGCASGWVSGGSRSPSTPSSWPAPPACRPPCAG
ncbi:MAG: alpha/beta fold hydrolase [Frankiaceae bacterium]